jgi:phosphate transport system permease protein
MAQTRVHPTVNIAFDATTSLAGDRPMGVDVPRNPAADPAHDRPRRIRGFRQSDWLELGASLVAGAAFTGTIFIVFDWGGLLAPFVWLLVSFLVIYRIVVGSTQGSVVATDRVMTVLIGIAAATTVAALLWLIVYVVAKGLPKLRPGFFTQDMGKVGPLDPGGGASHAIIGTLEQVGLAALVAVPAAILTAVYLHEIKGRLSPVIRFFVDAMSGLPSIVAGLLVYTVWIIELGKGFSGVAASAALTILMLPTVTRTAEEILRTIPGSLREAALALGAPEWRVVARVVIPTARSGLMTAAILGVARAIGETAPVLLTASYAATFNRNPFTGKQASLPMFVWQLVRQPNKTQIARAWTGALVLMMLVLVLFTLARFIGERGRKKRGL